MAKDDLNKSLDELAKEIQKSQKGTDKILEKQGKTKEDRSKFFEALARSQKKHLEDTRNDAIKERKEKLQAALEAEGRGSVEAKAVAALQATKWKEESDKRLKNNAFFLGRMKNTFGDMVKGMKKTPEEKKEESAGKKGLLVALKGLMMGVTGSMGKGAKGMFGGIMKVIKKVFGILQIKFLMIAGFVAFAISKLKIKDLKKMWTSFTEALTAVWEFLKPIVAYLAKWIEESVLPNLIEFFIDSFKTIEKTFTSIKERFEGFGEMTLEEKVKAVFAAINDLAQGFIDLGANLVKSVLKMFGVNGDVTVDKFTKPIKDFYAMFYKSFGQLFTGDWRGALKTAWDGLFGKKEGELGGIVGFIWNEVIKPVFGWFIDIAKKVALSIPGASKALKWLGIVDKTPAEKEADHKKEVEDDRRKESAKKARSQAGLSFFKGEMDEKKVATLKHQQLKDVIKEMELSKNLNLKKGPNAKNYNMLKAALEKEELKLKESKLKQEKKNAEQQAIRDSGKMTQDEFMADKKHGRVLDPKSGEMRSSPKAQDRAYQAYLAKKPEKKSGGIDWGFISDREGGSKLKGYVPDPEGSKSGVTIATGFDLGARGMDDLKGLSPELQAKLKPFLGFQGQSAQAALGQAGGLKITAAEAKEIDKMSKSSSVSKLKNEWNARAKKTGGRMFESLSSGQKTIAASVAFQYGSLSKAPKFRNAMQSGDWEGAAGELDNFGDSYGSRRMIEAAYLRNDSGGQLGAAHQESVRLASNTNKGTPVIINKSDSSQSSNTQVIQPKDARNNKAFPAPKVSIGV